MVIFDLDRGSSFIVTGNASLETQRKKHIYLVIQERDNMKERKENSDERAVQSWSSSGFGYGGVFTFFAFKVKLLFNLSLAVGHT